MKPQTLDADWMTVQETARYLKINAAFVRRLIADGKLVGVKLGSGSNSAIRISTASIKAILEKNRM